MTVLATEITAMLAHTLGPYALVVTIACGGAAAAWFAARFATEALADERVSGVIMRGDVLDA